MLIVPTPENLEVVYFGTERSLKRSMQAGPGSPGRRG